MDTLRLRLRVNGQDHEVLAPAHHTLLEVLRERLGLQGTKHGCELGECGACTVLLDGKPVLSCLTLPVECEGSQILTVEGLAQGGGLHPLQQAFAELGAAQCGYCTPGVLLASQALLREKALPGRVIPFIFSQKSKSDLGWSFLALVETGRYQEHERRALRPSTCSACSEIPDHGSSVALGELCGRVSRVERFEGHARSGDVRVAKYAGVELAWTPREEARIR